MNSQEILFRQIVRKAIETKTRKRQSVFLQEQEFRKLIKRMLIAEQKLFEKSIPKNDATYSNSTGINVLADLLRDIMPVIKQDYSKATSSTEERRSFRSHIINAAEKSLLSVDMNKKADGGGDNEELQEKAKVSIGKDATDEQDKFIDIRTDKEKEKEEPVDPKEEFGIKDLTSPEHIQGRNRAFDTYNKIETQIVDNYNTLAIEEDRELFFDYLIANLKLYFDMYDSEMSDPAQVEEPTNQAYDDAKQQDSENPEEPIADVSGVEQGIDQGTEQDTDQSAEQPEDELDLQLETKLKSKKLKLLQEKINKLSKTDPVKAKKLVREFNSKIRK